MYRLHSFCQSGNAYKVALMLQALGVEWEPVFVDYFGGQTREAGWRDGTNEMGEVPVLEDGATRLTQSGAILTYLARKHGAFEPTDDAGRLEVLRWLLFDNHKFTSYLATYRFARCFGPAAPEPALLAWLKGRAEGSYAIVEKHLARSPFMFGDAPTIADFSLAGYVFYPREETGLDLAKDWPAIAAWTRRLRELPNWKGPYDVLPGSRIEPKWA